MTHMTDSRAVEVLAAHNEWRRGGDGQATDPTTLGLAIDHAIARLREPAVVGVYNTAGEVVSWRVTPEGLRWYARPPAPNRQSETEAQARPPKPAECADGCPDRQVCDHCQWPPGPDAEAQAQGGGEVVQVLIDVAAGAQRHIYRGTCPDGIEGFGSRDPECPVCRAMDAAARTAPPSAPVGVEAQEHAETLARQLRWSTTSKRMRAALEAGIASLRALAPQPPAEAQAQGGGEVPKLVVTRGDGVPLPDQAAAVAEFKRQCLRTSPPSAPVGVEGLVDKWRQDADGWYGDDFNRGRQAATLKCADALEALSRQPAAPSGEAVAYLDLGVGGYVDVGTELSDEQLAALPKGRHMLGIIGTYGVDGYQPALPAQQPLKAAPQQPAGVDEAMVEEANERMAIAAYEKFMGVSADDPAYGPDLSQWMAGWNAALAQQPAAVEVDDDGRDAPAQATQAVPQGWPRAAKGQRDQGWTLEYRFLERVTDLAASRTEYSTSMEATEQVLIAALEVLAAQHKEPKS